MNLGWIMALGADTIILSSGTEYNTWILWIKAGVFKWLVSMSEYSLMQILM